MHSTYDEIISILKPGGNVASNMWVGGQSWASRIIYNAENVASIQLSLALWKCSSYSDDKLYIDDWVFRRFGINK